MATKLFLLLAFFAAGITASVARQQNLGNHGNILTISNAMKVRQLGKLSTYAMKKT